MNKGIVYAMSTVVPGLVKIGKTATTNFEQRMYQLEHNGYYNVVGLKREFAIEVENYEDKESLLDDIFFEITSGKLRTFCAGYRFGNTTFVFLRREASIS